MFFNHLTAWLKPHRKNRSTIKKFKTRLMVLELKNRPFIVVNFIVIVFDFKNSLFTEVFFEKASSDLHMEYIFFFIHTIVCLFVCTCICHRHVYICLMTIKLLLLI